MSSGVALMLDDRGKCLVALFSEEDEEIDPNDLEMP